MVGKKRSPITSQIVRSPNRGITPLSKLTSAARRVSGGKLATPSLIAAKTMDILSVLENSREFQGLAVGHIVDANPVSVCSSSAVGFCLGEIVAVKQVDGEMFCYVHFLGEDTRVDDWIPRTSIRALSAVEVEKRLAALGSAVKFFGLSSFSATSSSIHPRHHIKSIRGIQLGNSVLLKAWYPSPYPEMISCPNSYIKVCDMCLSYFKTTDELARHWNYCAFAHPPGAEIYRHHETSVFEIDGEAHNGYCERLLLLAKLFLEEKRAFAADNSQYAQVRTFHFYVLCRWNQDSGRAELVGYFSKLKNSNKESHILSCILVLPHEQRKGYGNFLIDLAYELARTEGRVGSAERPLSELGQLSFYPYWMRKIAPVLRRFVGKSDVDDGVSVLEISKQAGITPEDVAETLKHFGMLKEWGTAGVVLVANEDWVNSSPSSRPGQGSKCVFQPASLDWRPAYNFATNGA